LRRDFKMAAVPLRLTFRGTRNPYQASGR